ncbi:unnamed protein product [Toxocara canis]|uniref:Secreted protein n=1 Tax=Toxocara canis TaxID=6265 RepID=A0A183UCE7_TOXCA|nr:unnamed protein product [Toxocara canis]
MAKRFHVGAPGGAATIFITASRAAYRDAPLEGGPKGQLCYANAAFFIVVWAVRVPCHGIRLCTDPPTNRPRRNCGCCSPAAIYRIHRYKPFELVKVT